jgi:hypothetical protein
MASVPWVLLSSRLPRDPSRLRLAVWRRLRRLGAVLLNDAIWILPADAKTREAFEWLAEEIGEQGGTAFVWEAASVDGPQDREVARRFRTEADTRYGALADAARGLARAPARRRATTAWLQAALRQLRGLERALRLERRRDYFRAPGRVAAETAVRSAIEAIEARLASHAEKGDRDALGHPATAAH